MIQVFLALGSNIGNREKYLEKAVEFLEEEGIEISKKSSVYETEPFGVEGQEWYLNQVICGKTDLFLPSSELVRRTGANYRWEPRVDELVKERVEKYGRADYDYQHLVTAKNWGKIISWLSNLNPKQKVR